MLAVSEISCFRDLCVLSELCGESRRVRQARDYAAWSVPVVLP